MSNLRMTQNMLSHQSLGGMQTALARVGKAQEQLTTGRIINRPSDDPTGATTAMRIRSSIAAQKQYVRNSDDALGWLNQTDGTLANLNNQVTRARDIAIQGATTGTLGPEAREALATEVDQIRAGLIATGNSTYLDRPLFGGVTAGTTAYNPDGTLTDPDAVLTGGVTRTIADGAKIRIDVTGPEVFGPEGDSVFDRLTALAQALRDGDQATVSDSIDTLAVDSKRIINARAEIGARTVRVETAQSVANDSSLSLSSSLSEVENTDLAKATVDLQLQEVAYQAALGATSRVLQPSLLDFLR